MPVTRSMGASLADTMIMGTRLSLRIAVHRAKPSIPGIMMSRMIRSGQDAWNASNRLFPSSNVSTSYPSLTRNVCIKVRICSSSSATYMRFAIITSLHVTVFTDSIPSRQESVNRCHIFAAFLTCIRPVHLCYPVGVDGGYRYRCSVLSRTYSGLTFTATERSFHS